MTNNPTIDGVSRELLEQSEAAFKALLKQITEEDEDGDYWRVRFESRRDQLRALLDANVIDRQPVCEVAMVDPFVLTTGRLHLLKKCDKLYSAPTEVADLQSTIAQLQARIGELESCKMSIWPSEETLIAAGLGYPIGKEQAVKIYKAALKSRADTPENVDCEWCYGVGHDYYGEPCCGCCKPDQGKIAELVSELDRPAPKPFAYTTTGFIELAKTHSHTGRLVASFQENVFWNQPLFTAPPAPIAVVPSLWEIRVPDEPQNPESPAEYLYAQGVANRDLLLLREGATVVAEYACLDATAALNEVRK